jgi:hypothetical protein
VGLIGGEEWLVDRKQVDSNWSAELDKLDKEISYALDLLPAEQKASVSADDRK